MLAFLDKVFLKTRPFINDDSRMNKATKILLVDDDRDLRQVLQVALDMHGFKVVTSADGHEALFKFKNETFDLVITDLKMPKMDGAEFIYLVRKMADTPIFVMSACVEAFRTKLGTVKDSQNLTVIPKPFRPELLVEKIRDLNRPAADSNIMSFRAGELVFNDNCTRSDLFIVKEGTFSVYKTHAEGGDIMVARLNPGEALDDLMLYSNNEQSSKVMAETDGVLIRFPMEKFFETMNAQPAWFQIIMKTLSSRLCSTPNSETKKK